MANPKAAIAKCSGSSVRNSRRKIGSSSGVRLFGCSRVIRPRHLFVSNSGTASIGFRSSSYRWTYALQITRKTFDHVLAVCGECLPFPLPIGIVSFHVRMSAALTWSQNVANGVL